MAVDPTTISLMAIAGEDRWSRMRDRRAGELRRRELRERTRRRLLERGASDLEASVGAMLKCRRPDERLTLDVVRKYVRMVYG